MNPIDTYHCLDFRRQKLAAPKTLSAQASAHLRDCPACRSFAQRVDADEARIARVLAVEPPEGLADRVLLRVHHGDKRPWKLWALAATVILSFGIGIEQWKPRADPDYARLAVEHILHEPEAFTDHRLADPSQLRFVLANFGADLAAPIGTVRYMKLCPVAEGTAWHIVMDTEHGQVTLLLMPGKHDRDPGRSTAHKGFQVRALSGGQGTVALVTRSAESIDKIEKMMSQRLRWRT